VVSTELRPTDVGPNAWLVDEMYQQYLADESSVSESWQDFFVDYGNDKTAVVTAPADTSVRDAAPEPGDQVEQEQIGEPIRGVAAKIVENMEASLGVPTATSFREIPARLLEVNRGIINGYLGRTRGGKVSFTHLIGYAVIRALTDAVPVMNSSFHTDSDGKPRVDRTEQIGLGIAVDLEKASGARTLVVPCIKDAHSLDFREFVDHYEDLIRKVRTNKLSVDDFAGVTVTLTNPGTIGTIQSVPRLMPGQGLIVGVGTINYPTGFQAADPATLADLGISKVITLSSTYDHRIIQGAESGMFLKYIHELLLGEHNFYDDLFQQMGVPYEAVKWRLDDNPSDRDQSMLEKQAQVNALVNAYRSRGHLIADLDPLAASKTEMHPELDPASYGLTIWDLEREFLTSGYAGLHTPVNTAKRMKLAKLLGVLRDAYCRTVGIEYMHIQDPEEKIWIQDHVEGTSSEVDAETQKHLLDRLNAAEALEKFLGTKYVGQKRFGIEGAESAIPTLDELLAQAADSGMSEAIIGMAHRGRLNVLVNIVGKDYKQLFEEFEGTISEDAVQGSGDVKYHLGQHGTFSSRAGNAIPVQVAANPSHLEAVDPIVVGMCRASMDMVQPPGDYPILPILVHGDAAFAGQGVVAETLNMSQIRGYKVGGTVHLIINNQLGFTTAPHAARSSEYSTDVAKMVQSPIFHVNGDDPEACQRVARLAFEYRRKFRKDVVIDMVSYRRHGHNEGDDPSYTQPMMYKAIEARRSVRKIYTETLVRRGDMTLEEAEESLNSFRERLQAALEETREDAPEGDRVAQPQPEPIGVLPHIETAVDRETLERVYKALSSRPEGFVVHPKLTRQFESRDEMFEAGEVDWALGEAFAIGTLLDQGTSVRIAGQDSRRGTFSHRHAVLVDYETGDEFAPLQSLESGRTRFWIYDSLLSEYAAMGFEYGYASVNREALVCWEAQFGDFVNGAQVIIDHFLVSAEDKWSEHNGLVLILPHGFEGQGPEHSSGRMERFLLLAAEDNIQVANATTAAQYFHLLRRQVLQNKHRPLVVFNPKSMLRAHASRSPVESFVTGTFEEVLDDPNPPESASVKRVIFCTGKIAFEALAARDAASAPTAVVRVEQVYPWPKSAVADILDRYHNATEIEWLQEEPENMGAWNFVKGRLYECYDDSHTIFRVSRFESGSPATGSARIHAQEQRELIERSLADL
jgi:2-oxoglutarate decarboxylase